MESGASPRARSASASPASCGATQGAAEYGERLALRNRGSLALGHGHAPRDGERGALAAGRDERRGRHARRVKRPRGRGRTGRAGHGDVGGAARHRTKGVAQDGGGGGERQRRDDGERRGARAVTAAAQLTHPRDQRGRARRWQRARVAAVQSRPRRVGPGSRLELHNLQQRSPGQIDRPHHLRVYTAELFHRHRLERPSGRRLEHRREAAADLPQRARLLRRRLRLGQLAIRVGRPRAAEGGRFLLSEGVEIALELIDEATQRAARALAGSERQVLRQVREPLKLGRVVQRATSHGERELATLGAAAHQQDAQAVRQLEVAVVPVVGIVDGDGQRRGQRVRALHRR